MFEGIRKFGASIWKGNSSYTAATLRSQEVATWRPPLTSADSATLYDRNLANSRARDIIRNNPHARAGVMRLVDMLVGAGIQISPQPLPRALGVDASTDAGRKAMQDLTQQLRDEFKLFSTDPRKFNDQQRRLSFNGQLRLAARTWASVGETTGFLGFKPERGARYATCLRLVDPDRLCNEDFHGDTRNLRGGIEFTDDGTPVAYYIRNAHLADRYAAPDMFTWTRIPARTPWGRPVFIHGFEPDREDQTRAITPFAALMKQLHMIGKFADAELASATVNALFAAFVSSNLPASEVSQAFTPVANMHGSSPSWADWRVNYYDKYPATLQGVRIPVLPPGDEIKMNSSPRQTSAFHMFQTSFLQGIASSLGISYEQIAMDWSKVNYSSARAALNEVWRHIQAVFAAFSDQVIAPIYFAVIEEAFDRGYIVAPAGMPDFHESPGAYLNARWIGPGRGYVDPIKEAEASSVRMGSLTTTLEKECAEQGLDWEDTLDQVAREEAELKARNLVRIVAAPGFISPQLTDAPEDAAPQTSGTAPA